MPAAIASLFTRTPGHMMFWAIIVGLVVTTSGTAIAYTPDLPVGATIIVLCGILYLIALGIKHAFHVGQRKKR
jgi:zinc transport system permease protein